MNVLGHLLNRSQLIKLNRIKRAMREGSPTYPYAPPVMAAGASINQSIESQFPQAKKYEPLNWVEIVNTDTVDINIVLNGTETYFVPAGTTREIKRSIWLYRLTNLSAANPTTLGRIKLQFQRLPENMDSLARMEL